MIPLNLLPADLKWCVAGGYAACPPLATDIDVWVYDVPEDELQQTRAVIMTHLARNGFNLQTEECRDVPQPQYEHSCTTLKVGVVTGRRSNGKPIHVLVTAAKTVRDILDGFDVSTHAVAIGSEGYVVLHRGYTKPQDPPVALMSNEKTPERMRRIGARFGHKEVVVG